MGSDGDLTRRMALTLCGLLVVDLAFVAAVAYLLTPWLGPVRAAVTDAVPLGAASAALAWWLVVLVPALVAFVWAQLRYTRRRTLAEVDAREVTRAEYPDLVDRVHRVAQLADVTPPRVAVSPSTVPNSFAVGTLGNATVVVSEGLLDELSGEELDAVLAHEVAHVANRDASVMTLASFLPALTNGEYDLLDDLAPGGRGNLLLLGVAGLMAALAAGSVVDAPVGSPAFLGSFLLLAGLTVLLGGVALGVLTAPVVYLGRSLSRYREFAADRAAAEVTGDPASLASALRTIDDDVPDAPATDKRAYEGVRGLCFLPHGFEAGEERGKFHVETRSHPPTEERIDRLKALADGR